MSIYYFSDTPCTQFLQGSIRHKPDAYLDELRDALRKRAGKDISVTTVWRTLRRSGFTMKQVCDSGLILHQNRCNSVQITKAALERNEQHRLQYRLTFGTHYHPEQVLFVDESSFDRRTDVRGRAWALSGRDATRKTFFFRGRR